uniref:uncharacterized protein LOC100175458 isoform X2 n=1 Tax=Ciona intestinalis TaxID=7719 RepID=UPI000EF4766F|nr:uncharacterized protein LOC100175458 isoform X2 [Ciona intestinalis]|eukprot:XP_026691025.1 uncharacterized protein LOC100175458 isoform X2 [Ciona intestinalis]
MDEDCKVVLITGSSRGIGAAIAELFAKQGALLSITGRNKDKLSEVAKKCKENGSKQVLETIADLTKEEEMDKLMEETIKTFGKLDVLVNNAGIVSMTSVENYTGESFDKILAINLKAPIYLTKIAKPHLALTKGFAKDGIRCNAIWFEYLDYLFIKYSGINDYFFQSRSDWHRNI